MQGVIMVVFVVLAAWFVAGPRLEALPTSPASGVSGEESRPRAMRPAPRVRPVIHVGRYELNCMECHRLFKSSAQTPRRLTQHTDIVLDHGLNDRCFNCHDREDRDRLVLRSGRTVPFTNVERMCAECHGPTYRDWQEGMHGLTLGAWNPALGPQRRLHCSECHDPHSPAYKPMRLLAGPRTLRMGDQTPRHAEAVEAIDPLRKWQHLPPPHGPSPAADGERPANGDGAAHDD